MTVLEAIGGGGVALKIGFYGFVLFVELGEVGNEVLDDVGMREGVDEGFVGGFGGNAACDDIRIARNKGWNEVIHKQASVLTPSIFMAQLPHIPSLQLRRNVSVGSTSFLIRINASSIIGPVLFKSSVYDCILGFSVGVSGDHR